MNTMHPQAWTKFHGLPCIGPARQVWCDSRACRAVYHFNQKGFKKGFAACRWDRSSGYDPVVLYAEPLFATQDEAIAACDQI